MRIQATPGSESHRNQATWPEPQRSWGCAPSTSYSTSNAALHDKPVRSGHRSPAHDLSFSLQSDTPALFRSSRLQQSVSAANVQSKRQNMLSMFASISLSLPKARSRKLKAKETTSQKVCFQVSDLRLHTDSSTVLSARQSSSSIQPTSPPSYSLETFQLAPVHRSHAQQSLFASVSAAHSLRHSVRKALSIASDRQSVAPAIRACSQTSAQPLMELSQSSATAFTRAAPEGESEKPSLASAGHKLKKSVMVFPSNIRRLIAGAFAGALSKTAIAPIETIRMQVMGNKGTVTESIGRTWSRKGFVGFFSGNSADILRVMPSKAIELTAFDAYKKLLSHEDEEGKLKRPGPLLTGLAGAAAGMTSTIGLYPLETLRTRLAMGDYDSLYHAVKQITADEGFMALYQGVQASLIGVLPYAAIRLGVYDGLKWNHRRYTKQEHIKPLPTMLYGAFAGLLSASATFPVEVVRRRMMVGTAKGSTFGALQSIAREEGWRSLYKGIGLTWAKQAPQYAVTFLAYDMIKEVLEV